MSEPGLGPDDDQIAGATIEGEGDAVDSATADRAAAFDEPVSSAAGNVMGEDAVVASSPEDSGMDETIVEPDRESSYEADVASAYDDEDSDQA
jgi:hypothetical protein